MRPVRYALVTGASRGIGSYFARALAARSWDLILVARTKNRIEELAGMLSHEFGIRAATFTLDLTFPGAASSLSRMLAERGLQVELLVNNAGVGDRGKFLKLSPDEQSKMIRLNAEALVEITYHLLPPMIANRRGSVINVSSTAGFLPMPYVAVYAATKAFVTSFSMALAEEVRPYGITVVTLCPGPTRTKPQSEAQTGSNVPGGLQPIEEVIDQALKCLAQGGGLVVPRFLNRVMALSSRLLPLALSAKFVAWMMG